MLVGVLLCLLAVLAQALPANAFFSFLSPQKPLPPVVGQFTSRLGVPRTERDAATRYVAPRFQRFIRSTQDVNAKTSTALVAATHSNTIGALNPRDGGTVWRRVFGSEQVQGLFSIEDYVVCTSGPGGRRMSVMHGKSGRLYWSTELYLNASAPLDYPGSYITSMGMSDGVDLIALVHGHYVVRMLRGIDTWRWEPSEDTDSVRLVSAVERNKQIYVVAVARSGSKWRPRVYVLNRGGELLHTHDLSADVPQGAQGLLLLPWEPRTHFPEELHAETGGGPHVAWVSSDGAVHSARLDAEAPARTERKLKALTQRFVHLVNVGLGDRGYFVGVRTDGSSEALQVDERGMLHSAWEFDEIGPDAVYEGTFDRDGKAYITRVYFMRSQQLLNVHILWADEQNGGDRGMVQGMSFQFDHDLHGNVYAAPFEVSRQSQFQVSVRFAVVTSSGAVQLFRDAERQWGIEEGLSETSHTLLVNLPERHLGAAAVSGEAGKAPAGALEHESFVPRVQRHLVSLVRNAPSYLQHTAVSLAGTSAEPGVLSVRGLVRLLVDPKGVRGKQDRPQQVVSAGTKEVAPRIAANETIASLYHDHFGFRKMVVAASTRGKLYGIDQSLESSKLVWQRSILGFGLGEGAPEPKVRVTHMLQTRASGILENGSPVPPIVSVVAEVESGGAVQTRLYELNPLTGEMLGGEDDGLVLGDGRLLDLQVLPPSVHGKDPARLTLLALQANGRVLVWPADAGVAETLEALQDKLYLVLAHRGAPAELEGFRLQEAADGHHRVATWRMPFAPGEELLEVLHQPHDHVASLGRVRGDRSVLYKYLNPHARLVTTYVAAERVLNAYVVDIVKGDVVYHMQVPHVERADGLHATFAENWIMLQYATNSTAEGSDPQPEAPPVFETVPGMDWEDDRGRGYTRRLVSIELYERQRPETLDATNSTSFGGAASAAGAVMPRPPPTAFSQAFLLPYGVRSVATTRTTFGVTTKSVVLATDRENLVLLPRRLLDPRRPLGKPSAHEMEEQLVTYTPEIPDELAWRITRPEVRVTGLSGIVTAPALLESSSMVLATGLDWVYTTASPSGQFDRLQGAYLTAYRDVLTFQRASIRRSWCS